MNLSIQLRAPQQSVCESLWYVTAPLFSKSLLGLLSITVSSRAGGSSSGAPIRARWVSETPSLRWWETGSIRPGDHYPVIQIPLLFSHGLLLTDVCNSSHLWLFGCIIRLLKVIWWNRWISNESVHVFVEIWGQALKKFLCNIPISMRPPPLDFGNRCSPDARVRGGCEVDIFIQEAFLKLQSFSYSCSLSYHNSLQPQPANTGCDFNPRRVHLNRVPHSSRYWSGAVMHHWKPMICRQRSLPGVKLQTAHADRPSAKQNWKSGETKCYPLGM